MNKTEQVIKAANFSYGKYEQFLERNMSRQDASLKAQSMRWRLAHINAGIEGANFLTIQFEDFSVLPYRRDWRKAYADLFQNETEWQESETGNRWGKWQYGLKELVEKINE